jgi:ABC-2 type transport system ATP-binding protein
MVTNVHDDGIRRKAGSAVVVEHVSKEYLRRRLLRRRTAGEMGGTQALRDVSLRVEPGEMIGLLGPNGAGKTTLLKIVATLLYPTSGRVSIYGHDVLENQVHTRGMMGLVTCDERSFYWRLTGRQNLAFFAALYRLSHRQFQERSAELLEALGLSEAADRLYHEYSAGMKQKLAIARGLLGRPRLVLYDEPTRSLDPLSTQNIRRWIADRRRLDPQQTHLIATNQLDEAEQLCDRVVIINRGAIIAQGTIGEIRSRWHRGEYEIHRITCRGPLADGVLQPDPAAGLLAVEREPAEDELVRLRVRIRKGSEALSHLLRAILASPASIVSCQVEEVPFDEVFCSLVLGNRAAEPQEEPQP